MKPIIKYRGGKSKEIKYFSKYIPLEYDTYIEPFFGGGALFFYLEPEKSIINDINIKLIRFYKDIQTNYDKIKEELKFLGDKYIANQLEYSILKNQNPNLKIENKNENLYYSIREMFNYPEISEYMEGTTYFFINKTAYSGMIRYNRKGEYNVPFGRYKNFNVDLLTENHHLLLKKTQIYNVDFSEIFKLAKEDDFIFLDPPYDCIFSEYGNENFSGDFDEKHHRRLAEEFKNAKCKCLMIISKTELIEELYSDYIVEEYDFKYSVNIKNRFDTAIKHVIIKNY